MVKYEWEVDSANLNGGLLRVFSWWTSKSCVSKVQHDK